MIDLLLEGIIVAVIAYFGAYVFTVLLQSLFGLFPVQKIHRSDTISKICILIPGYKEDDVIISTVKNVIQQDYPHQYFQIYVIADSFKNDTLAELSDYSIQVINVEFDNSTKTKSINTALEIIDEDFEIIVVLDADNLVKSDFLLKINDAFQMGSKAIQGRRVAKNINTPYAILDAVSESINNHIFRKGASNMGLSSAIIGSGMAFEFNLFKQIMFRIEAIGGFDKELQLEIVRRGHKIFYLHEAIVFDEKVQQAIQYKNQRKRWISVQFIYLRKYLFEGITYLFKGNIDFFNLSIWNNLFLPKFYFLSVVFLCVITAFIIHEIGLAIILSGLIILFLFSQLIAIPKLLFPYFLKSIFALPHLVILTLGSLLSIKGANKTFINTTHDIGEIDEEVIEIYEK